MRDAAIRRGDYRQAVAYEIGSARKNIPEDVGMQDVWVALRPGIGNRSWWCWYKESRRKR
jgi:hypothetical protein